MEEQIIKDIATIKTKVEAIPEIRQDVKELGKKTNDLHLKYTEMQGDLAAYTDIKTQVEDLKTRVNIGIGAASVGGGVLGTVGGFLLGKYLG